jgi:hypothetical protein
MVVITSNRAKLAIFYYQLLLQYVDNLKWRKYLAMGWTMDSYFILHTDNYFVRKFDQSLTDF